MFKVTEAHEIATALVAAKADEDGTVIDFHNIAVISEVVYVLSQSKKAANKALAEDLRTAVENYFTARAAE